MSNYKETLNLPKTGFPMKASLANREPARLQEWQEKQVYQQIRQARSGQPQFILHDGPPYANGHLHCGHALNKILKDIIVKSKTLSGFDSPYLPGWDCHGLPIELNVEKKFGKAGAKLSAKEFRQKCRDYATSQINIQRDEFERLGVFGEWDNPYITMKPEYEANIIRALGKVISNGHLQQGFKPVYWCLDCRSALAEAEVEYSDKHSPAIDVRFDVIDEDDFCQRLQKDADLGEGAISVPIWTTTPWTLPANQAVAVNPNLTYALVACTTEHYQLRLLLAEALVESVMQRYDMKEYRIVATAEGKIFEGVLCQHPFYDRQVPVICGDHVTVEAGTGNVHTAPAHGLDDYAVAKKYDLPLDNPVGSNGVYLDDVELLGGQPIMSASEPIIEMLSAKGKLLHAHGLEHSYPHCWRHKTPVIFLATPQWFISMEQQGLREQTLAAIDNVQWIPEWGQARIRGMVEGRPDWCISRQRCWGVPIPLFVHKQTRDIHPNTEALIEAVAERVAQTGVDAWFEADAAEFIGDDAADYDKITDTLDVWFDSGVTHYCVLEQDASLTFPADLYLEGSDQHRGWFNSSITSSMAMNGAAPYKAVLTHGYVVDGHGYKLSKSRGNYIELHKLVKQWGADIIRLWVSAADYRAELAISDEILKRIADAYRRLRNTSRFLLANLFDFNPVQHSVALDEMVAIDRWAVEKARQLQTELCQAYDDYQFHVVFQKIHNFCAVDMGSFYLDIIKDRQYTAKTESHARRSCQTAMYHIIHAMARWLAPILTFTAEEIWQYIPGQQQETVFTQQWYEFPQANDFDSTVWDFYNDVRTAVNKVLETQRNDGVIGSALEAEVTLYCTDENLARLQALGDELRFVLITSAARLAQWSDRPGSAVTCDIDGLAIDVIASAHEKCARCWHRREDVGGDNQHPELCMRCVTNLGEVGETREFA